MSIPGNVSEVLSKSPHSKVGGGSATERQWYELATKGPKRRTKYGAQAVSIDGIRFDSKREAAHYETLKALQRAGQILWFAMKPVFVIEGGKYIPDFVVMDKYRIRIEDVKAWDKKTQRYITTSLYRRAKKQMRERYGIDVVEI